MCWSEEVSLVTFSIGIITSTQVYLTYLYKYPLISTITVAWQSVIWMQFFEVYIWMNVNGKIDSQIGSYGAIFTAMLQPPIMGIVLLTQPNLHARVRKLSAGLLIAYIYWYSYSISQISPLEPLSMSDVENCRHIDYKFREKLVYPDMMYSIFFSSFILLLIPQTDIALFLIVASGGTYRFSYFMWCWVSSLMPVLLSLYYEYLSPIVHRLSNRYLNS